MASSKTKSTAPHYTYLVEWSDEDQCFIGRCPELMLGGVHGDDRAKVFAELSEVVDEWIADADKRGEKLPDPLAGKKFSGKFVLRTGADLHKKLTLEALKSGDSLNNHVVKVLQGTAEYIRRESGGTRINVKKNVTGVSKGAKLAARMVRG